MRQQAGFSLVELSIVLVVVGLLMGSVINGATVYLQNSRMNATKQTLDSISRAITGFVIAKGRFPCPDSDDDGDEDCDDGEHGFLPYAVLGTDKYDPWGSRYLYGADTLYSDDTHPGSSCVVFTVTDDEGVIKIEDQDGIEKTNIAAVVYSIGPDGASQQVNPDGLEFLAKDYSPPDSDDPFDDIFVSISSLTTKADMTQAQRLPADACT